MLPRVDSPLLPLDTRLRMTGESSSGSVLLVDDDPALRELVARGLRAAGAAVVEAGGVDEALALADGGPDLVLLDLDLPDGSGLDVARGLREHPATRATPIVMLTSSEEAADIAAAYAAGVNGYAVKPVGFTELTEVARATAAWWLGVNHRPLPEGSA